MFRIEKCGWAVLTFSQMTSYPEDSGADRRVWKKPC